ncbi:flagellar protein FlgN [uncultured Sphingomonas sp.]|uniref:flagellar protein FlgN n=1 Tax=uncultured Sphingomonas sp. TaxID=158754 RepID=UPI0025DECBC3|nr:flagellar protein FlgN [uncultured Sphingomonas sp.]
MKRREALVGVIEALHGEIDALKSNDIARLEAATARKLRCIEDAAACDHEEPTAELNDLAREAHRLNETCRIYVNLMTANVRRRLQVLAGSPNAPYRPTGAAAYA